MKIAVATPSYPANLENGLEQLNTLVIEAANRQADIICFPETYLPGYPLNGIHEKKYTHEELQNALDKACAVAKENNIGIILPSDWYILGKIYNVAHVISNQGEHLGFQTKNQLDPSEDDWWSAGTERHLFEIKGLKFGISICHEGFRYPETVRWAAYNGAQIVFHPFCAGNDDNGTLLKEWAQKEAPYYEKAQMSRALENTVYVATSNYAFRFQEATGAIIDPNGNCINHQPYGKAGVLIADIDIEKATGFLAKRFKPALYKY
ncbi:MAG: carbon-nitrogen hydrolase family protein [Arachidicoccus sp.]|nr:carbon-nitrogen hydrolase family protein [Arachidicoccus sp.]